MGATDRPNILWLDAEDLSQDLGCYGNKLVHTPNLDRLAGEGIRFENAFVTTPVCSPSRTALITGVYPQTIGGHHHRSQRTGRKAGADPSFQESYKLPPSVRPVTAFFQEAGYFTCRGEADDPKRPGKLDYNFDLGFKEAFQGTDWSQRKEGQPFFAHVHFHETHRKFKNDEDHPIDPDHVEIPPYVPDCRESREDRAAYLETIQILDKKVGRVLRRLEEEGLSQNTVVFFTGDHGRPMVRAKQWVYDAGIRIPFLVRWPKRIEGGSVSSRLVSTVDFAPTWLGLAGIEAPSTMQGQDFLKDDGAEREYVFAGRDRCDETIDCIRSVSNQRYKYIRNYMPHRPYLQPNRYKDDHYPVRRLLKEGKEKGTLTEVQKIWAGDRRPFEELYDVHEDPHEVRNLADSPKHQEVLLRMRGAHIEWMRETKDLGLIPEPDLEELGREKGSKMAILSDLERGDWIDRARETVELAQEEEVSVDALLKRLKDDCAVVRFWAAEGLCALQESDKKVEKALKKCLDDASVSVRIASARALGLKGKADQALPVLLDILSLHENHAARHYAAVALEDMGETAASSIETIRKAVEDRYDSVHRVVVRLVEKYG